MIQAFASRAIFNKRDQVECQKVENLKVQRLIFEFNETKRYPIWRPKETLMLLTYDEESKLWDSETGIHQPPQENLKPYIGFISHLQVTREQMELISNIQWPMAWDWILENM